MTTQTGDDRRTRRTKQALRQGLSVLLMQKSLKDISVRELTDAVDLHRGTFYIHYRDIYDLYSQVQSEIVEEVNQILEEYPPSRIEMDPFPIILALIRYIYNNLDVCRMLLSENGDSSFVQQLADIIRSRCLQEWLCNRDCVEQERVEYYGCFMVSGCLGVLRRWVKNGTVEPPEEIAEIIRQMTVPVTTLLKQLAR